MQKIEYWMQGMERKTLKWVITLLLLGSTLLWGQTLSLDEVPMGHHRLSIWNTPEFQQALAESYLSKTETQPSVTAKEREIILKFYDIRNNETLDEQEKLNQALDLIQKNITPTSTAVFEYLQANLYYEQEKYQDAVTACEKAIEKDTPQTNKYLAAWERKAWSLMQLEEYEGAIEAFIKVIELGEQRGLNYGMLGLAYFNMENYLCAESAYRMAILLDSKTFDWKFGLALSLLGQGRHPEVVSLCGNLIAEYPNNAKLWSLQANGYLGMNQINEVAINLEMVDRLGESSVDSLNLLANIYVNQELYETAVKTYIRAIEKNPHGHPDQALTAAKVMTGRGALHETKTLIESIESLQSKYLGTQDKKDLLKIKARIAVAEEASEEEIQVLEEIVELDPLDGDALILMGQYYQRKEEHERAIFNYERAEGIEGYEGEAKLRHGQLLVAQGKYKEALSYLHRAQELKPREALQKYIEQVERVSKSQ